MVKAKVFWDVLCNKLNYRFFAGVPCVGLSGLLSKMSPDFLHYIPAVNEQVAVGLVNGAYVSNIKAAVLLPAKKINSYLVKFNRDNNIPLLIITESNNIDDNFLCVSLEEDIEACLNRIDDYLIKGNKVVVLFTGEVV